MPGAAAVAWLNQRPTVTPGPAAPLDRDELDSRPGASSGWRGNSGAGDGRWVGSILPAARFPIARLRPVGREFASRLYGKRRNPAVLRRGA